ncbi:hypothetical protein NXV03_21605 [Phocaeicola vulgatus]|nr:hypothetical protein [Phocaeicola vulgatus]
MPLYICTAKGKTADFQDKGNKMELKFITYNEDRKPLPLQRNQKAKCA